MNGIVRLIITLFIIVLLTPLAANAYGRHGYYRGGVWFGPLWSPWWVDPYPYYSSQQVIIERPETEYYVQPAPQKSEEPAYWYYCRKPEGYYPYVKNCPEGWLKVLPTPPPSK